MQHRGYFSDLDHHDHMYQRGLSNNEVSYKPDSTPCSDINLGWRKDMRQHPTQQSARTITRHGLSDGSDNEPNDLSTFLLALRLP